MQDYKQLCKYNTLHLISLERFCHKIISSAAIFYVQNTAIFKPRAANPNQKTNSFSGDSCKFNHCCQHQNSHY